MLLPTLSPYKTGTEWLKDERSSNIIYFRCLLPKTDFNFFYFELETLLNKIVKLCSSFFRKTSLNKNSECLFSSKKSTYFLTGPDRVKLTKCGTGEWNEKFH